MVDYDVKDGKVIVTRVVFEKLPAKSGAIVAIKGDLGALPKSAQYLVQNTDFWSAVNRAESRMGHFRVTGGKENQKVGGAIYLTDGKYQFDDISESAIRGHKYGSNALLGGGFAGNSQVPITGAVAIVISHPKWLGPREIEGMVEYRDVAKLTAALVVCGTRERVNKDYVLFDDLIDSPIVIRDERF